MSALSSDLQALREALLELPSSGLNGFEGLLATAFSKLLDVPFRLAKSGSQFGVDGKTCDPAFPVAFEAKLYREDVPSKEILNKIGALAIREDPVELWILATTGIVASQAADDLEALASKHGFATQILDWQPSAPRLAAVLSAAPNEVAVFLDRNVSTTGLAAKAIAAMQRLSDHPELATIAESMLLQLRTASVASPMARGANRRWLAATLSDRMKAKSRLGQVLTPLNGDGFPVLHRGHLRHQLQAALEERSETRLVAVLGEEGNGKSWLAMEACFELPTWPLVVVFSPEEFAAIPEGVNWDDILASKLVKQTDEPTVGTSEERWRRRFGRWRTADAPRSPRLLVLVDGLNQRPDVTWGRHLDSLVMLAWELGGCTVVTSRTAYFNRHVEPRLMSAVTQVVVPPWSAQERDEILERKGVVGPRLQPAVANSLLNPRLLGIALTLLDADTLESLENLSVTWLLFEHLRMLDREQSDSRSAQMFAEMLQDHATDLLQRVRADVSEDRDVFKKLEPASEGRFFEWLDGEPNRYRLREQGLVYALGLAVIEELRSAVRNGRNVHEALQAVLEPIESLDQTAEATFAALTIACLDPRVAAPIGVALLAGFAGLQNPQGAMAASLAGLARRRVSVFCDACEVLWMASTPAPNGDWLEDSLRALRHRPDMWRDMLPFLHKWLRCWWPDIRVNYKLQHTQRASGDERRDAIAERDLRIGSLTEAEQEYEAQLVRQNASPFRLMQLALRLCAGMPLADLAGSLACASFSIALTSTPFSPNDQLSSLIRFNRRDWSATRDQLTIHATRLSSPGASVSGRWAAVALLRATGALGDAASAHALCVELTRDRDRLASWRRVKAYCATDPCDPGSERPDNMEDAADKYKQIDIGKLRLFMGMTEQDHFLESALPGLARFSKDVAVKKHRELLAAIPSRRGLPLRQATWTAMENAALIDRQLAAQMLAQSISLSQDPVDVDEDSVVHVQQGLLLAAFPHLSPSEQLAGVQAISDPDKIWQELVRNVKDGSPEQLVDVVRRLAPSDVRVAAPLSIAGRPGVELPDFATMLPELLASPHSLIRSLAFNLAASTTDLGVLQAVVASVWTSVTVPRSTREYIAGSIALIEAARNGVVSLHDILPRIAPETFGVACARLDDAAVEPLARMLDVCVRAASNLDVPLPAVDMVLAITRTDDLTNARYSLEESTTRPAATDDTLRYLLDDRAEFDARQKRLREACKAFREQLTPQVSAIALDAFDFDDIRTIERVTPDLVRGWVELLREATVPRRRALRNFGFFVASALTHGELRSEGLALLELLQDDTSFVHVRYTLAGLPLEAVALWRSADGADIDQLRFARLDACVNDHEMALEAATAIYAGKSATLKSYVQARLASPLPVDVARAITVAGFSDDAEFANEVAARFAGEDGFLVTAAQSCRYAMDRYRWSTHWFDQMLTARTEEDFWIASVLFLKIVDGRFDVERRDAPAGTETFNTWWWSVERRLNRRFGKWADKRKKTLFGSKVPDLIFLDAVLGP